MPTQDTKANATSAANQTFKTVQGLSDKNGVSFESVAIPGKYLTVENGVLALSEGKDKENATFIVENQQY